mgnify:CR=1 FL=1
MLKIENLTANVGDKEKAAGLVAVRVRGGQDLGQMSLETLIERLKRERDGRVIGTGKPGPVSKQLIEEYHALTKVSGEPI